MQKNLSYITSNQRLKSSNSSSPFGMKIQKRPYSATSYRFGFNGKEMDNESFSGAIAFEARIYDSRLGRWMALDPLQTKYPELSPYNFVANSPGMFLDPDGRVIDLSTLTPEQKAQYKTVLAKLSKSELHSYIQNALENSLKTYTIVVDNDMKGGGSFNPETGVIKMNLTVMNSFPEIASEEMFHALQKDKLGDEYSKVSKQNIETEGDLYVHYIQATIYKNGNAPMGHLDDELLSEMGLFEDDLKPSSEQISSKEYQSLYSELVQKRYEKYKDNPIAPPSYKAKPGTHQPTTLLKATKESEANEQKLEGPRLNNGDYYAK